ncbi:hypothetical protein [Micromonospora tulbaghiae]|uniref:hypothetical protein n=1 Tax=Micromonospora tulbaghiae TaxID=479978 RepID=UPI00340BC9B2
MPSGALPCAVVLTGGMTTHTLLVDAGRSLCVIAHHLATRLASEMSMDGWGEVVPPRPGQDHPRRLVRRDDSLVWQFPRNGAHPPTLVVECSGG